MTPATFAAAIMCGFSINAKGMHPVIHAITMCSTKASFCAGVVMCFVRLLVHPLLPTAEACDPANNSANNSFYAERRHYL